LKCSEDPDAQLLLDSLWVLVRCLSAYAILIWIDHAGASWNLSIAIEQDHKNNGRGRFSGISGGATSANVQ
jgi:hypothetical protein